MLLLCTVWLVIDYTLIPYIYGDISNLEPVSVLSDEQVLVLTELEMQSEQDARLSELLDRSELQTLMQVYQEGLLRKATALSEAVKRGLIEH
ncbi:hypothetical protein [Nostoc sp.]|uniref:hypothetical protein n=1 Tax=Nostoc sp. TaxID=1180 RepID=UPI002FF90C36